MISFPSQLLFLSASLKEVWHILLRLRSKDESKKWRSCPDLYSVPPDPPRWELLWITPSLLLRSQSQWGECTAAAGTPQWGREEETFDGVRSGIMARLVTAQREKKKNHKKMESNRGERRLRASAAHLRPIRRRSAEMPGLPGLCFCFHYQKAFL